MKSSFLSGNAADGSTMRAPTAIRTKRAEARKQTRAAFWREAQRLSRNTRTAGGTEAARNPAGESQRPRGTADAPTSAFRAYTAGDTRPRPSTSCMRSASADGGRKRRATAKRRGGRGRSWREKARASLKAARKHRRASRAKGRGKRPPMTRDAVQAPARAT